VKDLETELEAVKKDGFMSGSGGGSDGKAGVATRSLRFSISVRRLKLELQFDQTGYHVHRLVIH
jgi:hypothetical protein